MRGTWKAIPPPSQSLFTCLLRMTGQLSKYECQSKLFYSLRLPFLILLHSKACLTR